MKIAIDSSCIVAALGEWHEHHRPTVDYLEACHERTHQILVVQHSLLEAFSTLTATGRGNQRAPDRVIDAIERFLLWLKVEQVPNAPEVFDIMRHVRQRGRSGGAIYDASIAWAAAKAGARVILTLDDDDFRALSPASMAVISPLSPEAPYTIS